MTAELTALAYGTADKCPACWRVHAQPTDWPRCPRHGHWMYEIQATDAGFTYACQATYPTHCTYRHTQPERADMTATNEAVSAALAIREEQDTWTPTQLAAFRQLGMDGAPDDDLAVFLYRCQVTGLDPFARQIRLRKDRQQVNGKWENRWSIETEIEGYRVIAQRAAKRAGVTLHYGDPVWYDADEGEHKIWLAAGPPAGASFTVYKDGHPFKGAVSFTEFANMKDGRLLANWATMPAHMIAKCAEALALRMAFPHDLQGIAASDETAHLDAADIPAGLTVQQIPPPEPPRRGAGNGAGLRAAISAEFERLGIADADERKVYVYKLANKEPGAQLDDSDLRFVLDSLHYDPATGEGCEDLAALIDLVAVEAQS